MVEPSNFTELYTESQEIRDSFSQIKAACDQAYYIYRFNVEPVRKLSKYLDMLTKANNTIQTDLDAIQLAFDNLETNLIIYFHNHKRTQDELLYLAEQQEQEREKAFYEKDNNTVINSRTEEINLNENIVKGINEHYKEKENQQQEKYEPIIKIDNPAQFKEEMDKIAEYISQF